MPFTIRSFRRFPVRCAVTDHAGPFLTLPLAYCSGFWLLITLLVLSSGPACAVWVAVEKNNQLAGIMTYVRQSRRHSQKRESGDDVAIN